MRNSFDAKSSSLVVVIIIIITPRPFYLTPLETDKVEGRWRRWRRRRRKREYFAGKFFYVFIIISWLLLLSLRYCFFVCLSFVLEISIRRLVKSRRTLISNLERFERVVHKDAKVFLFYLFLVSSQIFCLLTTTTRFDPRFLQPFRNSTRVCVLRELII